MTLFMIEGIMEALQPRTSYMLQAINKSQLDSKSYYHWCL